MKKFTSIILSICMLLSVMTGIDITAFAETYTGKCGANLTWTFNSSTGAFTVKGKGAMSDYSRLKDVPWYDYRASIKSVDIPYGVNHIGNYAFAECEKLTSVNIPSSVATIGRRAFNCCISLKSIVLPDSVTTIGDCVFECCISLKNIVLSERVTAIEAGSFMRCESLASITLPESITRIGSYAFLGCNSLKEVKIPKNVSNIGIEAFAECTSLTSINVDSSNSVYYSQDGVLLGNSGYGLMLVEYPIGKTATEYTVPNGVKAIQSGAFYNCKSLTKITIPKSVAVINEAAFCHCSNIKEVYYNGTKEEWEKIEDGGFNDEVFNSIVHYSSDKAHTFSKVVTKATLTSNGSIVSVCSCGAKKSVTVISRPKTFTLSTTKYTYDGKEKKPSVKVTNSNGKTISTSNYTVSYASGRKNVGKYSVKITFKGNYSGTKTLYFTIVPKSTSISKLTSGSKKITVKLNKNTTQTTGYQLQYATNSKFNSAKSVSIKNTTTSKTLKSLKGNKKYYVRVRTYKTINGTKYYSAWSKSKSITTKK